MNVRILVLLMAFLVMGFGDLRGSFLGISREVFGVTAAQGSLIPVFGAAAFSLVALPAGLLAMRRGKAFVLKAGLLVTAGAHLLPWILLDQYWHLLLAIFLIGVGMTLLLVSGNPLLWDVAGPSRYSRNLTFAQFFKSLGSIAGPYIVAFLATLGFTWKGVFPAFAGAALVVWAVVVLARIPDTPPARTARLKDIAALLVDRAMVWKFAGIFLFVGSEMGMNNFLASHLWLTFGMGIQGDAIRYGQGLFWLSQGLGRILGTLALTWMDTIRFFRLCAFAGLAGLGGLIFGNRETVVASVVLCGVTFSNIWPALFALTLETRPDRAEEVAGLSVMANVGGAFLPLAMGWVSDTLSVRWCFLVPSVAFLYLAGLAIRMDPQGRAGAGSRS